MITDKKIQSSDITTYGVVSAPDKLVGDAQENKAVFDRLIRESVMQDFNGLIDELYSGEGAANIGKTGSGTVQDHIDDTNNPHQVTKAQVGLGNVDNTSDANKPISSAANEKFTSVETKIDNHIADKSNPHKVTKAQVGLGNVDNTADVNKPISTPQAAKFAELEQEIQDSMTGLDQQFQNFLAKDNTTPYTPSGDYNPATKKFVEDSVSGSGNVTPSQVERWDTAASNVDDLLDGTKKAAHAEYADAVGDIDCGVWDVSEVEIHNETPLAHQNLKIDGNVSAGKDNSQTLEEHMQNPTAHQNLVIDGNAGQ